MKKYFINMLLVMFILCLSGCSFAGTILEKECTEPLIEGSVGFEWEVRDGVAYLIGIGNVSDPDIIIPAKVRLVQTNDGWTDQIESEAAAAEKTHKGILYDVVVAGDAFRNCDQIVTVSFADGVRVEDDKMNKRYGMFSKCDNLTHVYSFPTDVTSLKGTFSQCTSLVYVAPIPDTVTDMSSCFMFCDVLVEAPEFPAFVQVLDSCFEGCSLLETVHAIPESVTSMNSTFARCVSLREAPDLNCQVTQYWRTFYGCTSLQQVPLISDGVIELNECFRDCFSLKDIGKLPNTVQKLIGCFQRCTSLVTVNGLPDSVTDMTECFLDCVELREIDKLPQSLETMTRCFAECNSLITAPEIPDGVWDASQCFVNCNSLSGTVTVPQSTVRGKCDMMLWGCNDLDVVQFATCPYNFEVSLCGGGDQDVFLYSHQNEGVCPYCGYEDAVYTELECIVLENIPAWYANWFTEFIYNEVPDFLLAECKQFTFTDDIMKYYTGPFKVELDGFASVDTVYIRLQSSCEELEYTIYHELGHCFDLEQGYRYLIERDANIFTGGGGKAIVDKKSQSVEWIQLHEKEGETARRWYSYSVYKEMSEEEKRTETFAIAFSKYFTAPDTLRHKCPLMYEYMDNLLKAYLEAESDLSS